MRDEGTIVVGLSRVRICRWVFVGVWESGFDWHGWDGRWKGVGGRPRSRCQGFNTRERNETLNFNSELISPKEKPRNYELAIGTGETRLAMSVEHSG